MMRFNIADRSVGDEQPVYIIAEMSANHGGDLATAIEILHAAKRAGADAVKLQSYTADSLTLDAQQADFLLPQNSPWRNHHNFYRLYQKAAMPWQWHAELFAQAEQLGLTIFSSPFDHQAVELLANLQSVAYKIASPEITDIPLIEAVARQGKPVIFSTGLAEQSDIELAIQTMQQCGNQQYAFLKCTTAYPAPMEQANLRMIAKLKQDYGCVVGLSDHCIGNEAVLASVALGANIIEKHFMLNDGPETADSFFSLTEQQFTTMVKSVRAVELALGDGSYQLSAAAQGNLSGRRSLYIAQDIAQGEMLTVQHVKSVRPSFGLHPKYYHQVIGAKVKKSLRFGDRLALEDIDVGH